MLIFSVFGLLYSTTECTFNADPSPPRIPEVVGSTSGDQVINITWRANLEEDFEGYNLYRSENPISDVQILEPYEAMLADTVYSDTRVVNGTTYYYRLTAVDINENESAPSAEIAATPFAGPPDRPKANR